MLEKMILRPLACATPSATVRKPVQVFVAIRPGPQQVIGILDDKGVGAADEKPREDLVGRQRAGVARDHHSRLRAEPPGHRAQDGADQPGLAGPRRSVQHQHGGGRFQVALDEPGDAALQLRIGLVEQHVVGPLLHAGHREFVPVFQEMPLEREHRLRDQRRARARDDADLQAPELLEADGPDLEPARTVVALAGARALDQRPRRLEDKLMIAQALGPPAGAEGQLVEKFRQVQSDGNAEFAADGKPAARFVDGLDAPQVEQMVRIGVRAHLHRLRRPGRVLRGFDRSRPDCHRRPALS
ncbi:MAG: hypothetical protein IPI73_18720 [Betaproteobacteria bacterium]|nr:hypothetical protein [Betaproteobacteria bacterium]